MSSYVLKQDHDFIKSLPTTYRHDVYLDDDVVEPAVYRDLVQLLNHAAPQDEVHIHINTYGGRMDTTIAVIAAMGQTQAQTFTYISGHAYSAGSMIFLAGDIPVVHEFSDLMIHAPSGGDFGKHSERTASIKHSEKHVKSIYHAYYRHFLSEKEIDDILEGKDLYLCFDEIVERLEYRLEAMNEEMQEQSTGQSISKKELLKKTKKELVDYLLGIEGGRGILNG